MSLIQNERTKLLATALNNLGVATIVTGFIAPSVGALYGSASPARGWLVVATVCVLAGAGFIVLAQIALGRLQQ